MITRKQYVDRLAKMLDEPKPCSTCPGMMGFVHYETHFTLLKAWRDPDYPSGVDSKICDMCMDFIDLPRTPRCPCFRLAFGEALRRASARVREWAKGSHKWQKEVRR